MSLEKIEKKMDEYFVRKAPFQIPANGRETLVNWIPYLALIFGILSVLAALALWNAGHDANVAIRNAKEIGEAYGIETRTPQLGLSYYISVVALLTEAAFLLIAYTGLKDKSKTRGWNLLLYSAGASLVYGLFIAFTIHGGLFDFVTSLLSATVTLYILAQIKSYYNDKTNSRAKKAKKAKTVKK